MKNTNIIAPSISIFKMEDLAQVLAKRMADIRKAKNLTQNEIAEALGINQQNYSHYEKGIRIIPIKRLPDLAKALDTSIDELFGLNDKKNKPGPKSKLEARFELVRKLPKKDQQYISETIDRVIASNTKKAS